MLSRTGLLSTVLCGAITSACSAQVLVDLELSILIDSSGSVGEYDYNLQLQGFANAFRNTSLQQMILDSSDDRTGSIAVNVIRFSNEAVEVIPFRLLDSAQSINTFADDIELIDYESGWTNTPAALLAAGITMGSNDFLGTRTAVNMSTDGDPSLENSNSEWEDTKAARDLILQDVDSISAILVGYRFNSTLVNENMIGGAGAFAISAADFLSFDEAALDSLQRQIIPAPGAGLVALAGVATGITRRRRA